MSGKVMGEIWTLDLPRNERDVLLAMADHGDDFGRGVRPSIDYVAWKVGLSRRETIRCLNWLKAAEILRIVAPPGYHKPTEYRIILTKAPRKPEFVPHGDFLPAHSFDHEFDEAREEQPQTAEPVPENGKGDRPSPFNGNGKGDRPSPFNGNGKGDQTALKGDQSRGKGDQTALKGDRIQSPEPLLNRSNKPFVEPLIRSPEKPETGEPAEPVPEVPGFVECLDLARKALRRTLYESDTDRLRDVYSFCSNREVWEWAKERADLRKYGPTILEFRNLILYRVHNISARRSTTAEAWSNAEASP